MHRYRFATFMLILACLVLPGPARLQADRDEETRLLYVAAPGIRNYVEYGGIGILVYDVTNGHRFVKRIPTFDVPDGEEPDATRELWKLLCRRNQLLNG